MAFGVKHAAEAGYEAGAALLERPRLTGDFCLEPAPRHPRLISLVVPVFDEKAAIAGFMARVEPVVAALGIPVEFVFVDDGSTDGTRETLRALGLGDPRIRLVGLSRNFGKEAALSAGLDRASGDVVVPIDVDLQDPPELIPEFVSRWREGYDVVYGVRSDRQSDTMLKRSTSRFFYFGFNRVATRPIPPDTGDFRLLDRRVVEALKLMPERNRFMKGLFAWVGFRHVGVPYVREKRLAGESKFAFWRLSGDSGAWRSTASPGSRPCRSACGPLSACSWRSLP
jgi:polyisoprenyl-phosphate glycosyltransferase